MTGKKFCPSKKGTLGNTTIGNRLDDSDIADSCDKIKDSENVEPDPLMVNPIPSTTILEDDLVQPLYKSIAESDCFIAEDHDGLQYYVAPPADPKRTLNLPAVAEAESGADLPTVAESEYSAGEPPPIR